MTSPLTVPRVTLIEGNMQNLRIFACKATRYSRGILNLRYQGRPGHRIIARSFNGTSSEVWCSVVVVVCVLYYSTTRVFVFLDIHSHISTHCFSTIDDAKSQAHFPNLRENLTRSMAQVIIGTFVVGGGLFYMYAPEIQDHTTIVSSQITSATIESEAVQKQAMKLSQQVVYSLASCLVVRLFTSYSCSYSCALLLPPLLWLVS